MKIQLVKGNLVDRVSVKGEVKEIIEKLKKLYVWEIELTQNLIICKVKEEREVF